MRCFHCMREFDSVNANVKFCPYCGKKPDEANPPHHLPVGTVLHGKYIVGNSIGEGGFGITYVGYDQTLDLKIAVKEFFPSGYANRTATVSKDVTLNYSNMGEYFQHGREGFLREAKSIAKFSSEDGIVDVRDYFTENSTAYIVMEYLDGETLSHHIRKNGKYSAADIFRRMIPVMHSLEKMHKEGIIHRDISPDNIMLLNTGSLKLMDFGSARYFSGAEQKTMSIMLKPGYAPYEQYSTNGNQGPWTDVYGMCATIYKCITGKTPPDSLDRCQQDGLQKPSALGADISPALENVLMYGMAIYHNNRCQSMEELIKLTQQALNGGAAAVPTAAAADDINRVRTADERYKTMFADGQYPPVQPQSPQTNWEGYQQYPQQPKKSNAALIAVLIAATAVIVAGIAVMTVFLLKSGDDEKPQETTAASQTSATEQTTAATTPPTTAPPTTAATVKVSNVTGKKLADAKKALENQGLTVKTVEEESQTVNKGYVIRQSIAANQVVGKGSEVTLYVSKGSTKNPDNYDQKVVVSASSGSSYATLTLYNWENGGWSKKFSCDATVGKNGGISSNNSENNTLTPKGNFKLGVVLTQSNLDTKMEQYFVNNDTVVCDDPGYPGLYNQIGTRSKFGAAGTDPVGKKICGGSNNALIFIEHNGNGFSSSGVSVGNSSVITICGCYSSIEPTNGCIDISASNMTSLLKLMDKNKNPHIITEVK